MYVQQRLHNNNNYFDLLILYYRNSGFYFDKHSFVLCNFSHYKVFAKLLQDVPNDVFLNGIQTGVRSEIKVFKLIFQFIYESQMTIIIVIIYFPVSEHMGCAQRPVRIPVCVFHSRR